MTIVDTLNGSAELAEAQVDAVAAGQAETDAQAAARVAQVLPAEVIDGLLADAERSGQPVDGADGLVQQMIGRCWNGRWRPRWPTTWATSGQAPIGLGNDRNGHTAKTVLTTAVEESGGSLVLRVRRLGLTSAWSRAAECGPERWTDGWWVRPRPGRRGPCPPSPTHGRVCGRQSVG